MSAEGIPQWLQYAFAGCLTITVLLVTVVYWFGLSHNDEDDNLSDVENEKEQKSSGDKSKELESRASAAVIATDVAKRVTRRATIERAREIDEQEENERLQREELLNRQVEKQLRASDAQQVKELSKPTVPKRKIIKEEDYYRDDYKPADVPLKKIIRDPKVVAYENELEGRAREIFQNLENSVKDRDEALQLASLDQVRDIFEEIESKYSMSRASLVGCQSVICNMLLKYHGFDQAQEIKKSKDAKLQKDAQWLIEKVAPLVWCS